jgi:hypothetical protein
MKRLIATAVLVAFAAAPALADPKSDLLAAFTKFNLAKSYHMSMTSKSGTAEMDFAPPSKIHMKMPQGEMIKIDQTMWMNTGGTWRKFTIPGMDQIVSNYTGMATVTKGQPDDFTVTDLGIKSPDGAPLHAYSVVNKSMNSPSTIYVDAGGNVVRMEDNKGDIMRISQVNSVDIEPPN